MIKIIIGKKGSGKTKKLIDLVNGAAESSKGNVVCVEKGDVLLRARLICALEYKVPNAAEEREFGVSEVMV